MNQERSGRPLHLWIVGVLSLLWNAMGAFDYLATKLRLEGYLARFNEAQLEYFLSFPSWFTAFWALGVWGALLGSFALLLASRHAVALFSVSLAGMLTTSLYSLGFSEGLEVMGPGALVFSAVIFVIAVLLLVYAARQRACGVLV